MPGIAGIFGKTGANLADVARMTRFMTHEPFYVTGTYADDATGLCAGWAVPGGSSQKSMPLWNERRDVCLIFSGENFMERDELRRYGVGFDTSDSRCLLALHEAIGLDFIEKLNGWFSGLLIDLRHKRAVLFNDRYGLGRIYTYETAERFFFASEAKALLEICPELRRLDPRSAAEAFACGSVMQDRTLFEGVRLLPAASAWSFEPDGHIGKKRYFDRESWEAQEPLGDIEFYPRLAETFGRILPKYFGGPDPVGMSLTGGLDGRMIMACAHRPQGTLPCYSFNGMYRDCADVTLARRIASLCGQSHRTIRVGSEFLADFPGLAAKAVAVSDGTMDVTGAVELYVNRIAREIAPVRLTGNYGSEILRSNVAFRLGKLSEEMLDPDFARLLENARHVYRSERDVPTLSFIAFKQVPWHHYARLSVEQSQLTLRSPFLDNELVALMFRAPRELAASNALSLRVVFESNPRLGKLPTDRGQAYGDESLVTKLRKLLVELTVKAEYAYDYGMPQNLARLDHRLAPLHLERLFLGRHKFYHFRIWYRDQLADYVKQMLLDPRALARSYIRKNILERMVMEHTSGTRNWTQEIHRVLTLELLQRHVIERW